MKYINTLITDIQYLLTQRDWVSKPLAQDFASSVSRRLSEQFSARVGPPTLRLSRMGQQCPCALWYSIHHPELAEPLPPWAEFKYSFGHIIEAQAIMLSKAAGHSVTGEQDELVVDGIIGHRDCVIDGCLVDVKSTSSFGFKKFKDGSLAQDDQFGYLSQLDGYLLGSRHDPLVTNKESAYLLAIDKQLGHCTLYEHKLREDHIRNRIAISKSIVNQECAPACECGVIADGKSGNIRLDTKASYNVYKFCCRPSIRTFLYSDGPRYLVKVVKRPIRADGTPIPEVDKHGKYVYN